MDHLSKTQQTGIPDFLSGGGEMGSLIRSKDWSKTPLGSPATWPQSLRTTVSLCMASNFPIAIAWGPHRVQIYNDGYLPITGDKHPASMGQDFKECWLPAWPVIGQAFEEASLGQTRFLENQRIFIDRFGYLEETFFTFSFSPILDESGGAGGLFHPVLELTQQTLAERRLNVLRAIADSTVNARTVEEASYLILECLKDFELDIPFALLYSIAADGKEANLQGSVGVKTNSLLAPSKINLHVQQSGSWPFTEAIEKGTVLPVEELGKIFGAFACGPYAEPPEQALVFPVIIPSPAHNKYFLVAGVSSRRRLDEKYLLFYELLAASVTSELAKARVYEEERKKAEALAEIDKAKTVFFSNISHEFRTPLTLMLSPLEELLNQKKNNFSEIDKGNIETTHRNAIRLLKLVNTLLDFSRIESGRVQAVFSLVDIVQITKNLASNFRSVIEKAGMKLIVITDSIIQPVYVDKQMWEKIVFNLLSNAFKYTLEGEITVELLAEKDFVVLKVRDTGVGIPENELPKMFERFHRVQNVTGRTYEGTGIGLSLIKELVQMHHGTINVESVHSGVQSPLSTRGEGQGVRSGSVFTVKIPTGKKHINDQQISKKEIDSDEISSAIYVDEIETLLETGKSETLKASSVKEKSAFPTILIVDDNADMREHISSILSNSFNVITANNGMDALHKMKETIPALVLSDIMMPVMDGIVLLKEIKSNKSTEHIPVIFLTARAGEESKIEGLETGADDYLVKPFSSKELLARVSAQINLKNLQKQAVDTIRHEEKQQAFLLKLSDALRPLGSPVDIEEVATKIAMDFMDADRCHYSTIEEENIIILRDAYRGDFPSVVGVYPISSFPLYKAVLDAGRPFVVDEVHTSSMLDEELKEMCLQFQYGSFINVPVIKNGKPVGLFSLVQSKPRKWTDTEVQLTIETAERTWAAVERAKAEYTLGRTEKQLRAVLEQAPLAIAITGTRGDIQFHNTMFDVLWGRPAHDTEALNYSEVYEGFHLDGTPIKSEEWPGAKALMQGEEIIDEVLEIVHQSGSKIPCSFNAGPIRNEDGKITGAVVLFRDVTEQVELNKKIKESEHKIRNLIAQAPVAMCLYKGEQFNVEIVNQKMLLIWGKELETVINKSVFEAMPEAKGQGFEALLQKVYDTGESFSANEIAISLLRNGKDEKIYINLLYEAFRESDGTISGIVEIANEVTEQVVARKKIEQSEKKFGAAILAVEGIIWTNNAIGEMEGEQPGWAKLTGQSFEEYQGFGWARAVHPDDAQPTVDAWNEALKTKSTFEFEHRVKTKQNGWRLFSVKAVPALDENGTIQQWVGVHTDITEQNKAVQKIKESENRFRSLADQSPMIVYLVEPDAAATMSYFNKSWLDYTGQTFEDAIGRAWNGIVHPDDLQGVLDVYVPAFVGQRPYTLPAVRLRRHDGEYRWHLFKGNPRYFHGGEFIGFVGVGFDIHEQKIADEQLRESEERFRSLAQTLPQFVWVTDGKGNAEFASKKWKEYSGIEPGGEKEWKAIVHPDDYDNINAAWEHSLTTGTIYRHDVRFKSKEGEYRWHTVVGEPTLDKENKIVKWVGAFTDIQNLKDEQKRKDDFLSMASHELKTPVTTIKAYAQLVESLLEKKGDVQTLPMIKKMSIQVSRLTTLIEDLLDNTKMQQGKLKYNEAFFDFNDLVNDVLDDMQKISSTHQIICNTGGSAQIFGDKDKLSQVFNNLLSNAIKYSPNAQRIIINTTLQHTGVKLSIQDFGIGISEKERQNVFEQFYRVGGKNLSTFPGLGIGLYICAEIVRRQGGKIWFDSVIGKGSTFYVWLPFDHRRVVAAEGI